MVMGVCSMLSMSLLLLSLTHPAMLAAMLGGYALIVSLLLALGTASWFMYMLVLVFLGGVMVLIAYMTTLAANEKFFFYSSGASVFAFLLVTLAGGLFILNSSGMGSANPGFGGSVLTELFSASACLPYVLCVLLLLIVLIGVVKVVKLESGPLAKRL